MAKREKDNRMGDTKKYHLGYCFYTCFSVATHGHSPSLYYWFGVGEGTLQIHHLTSQFTPATPDILQALPPPSYQRSKEKKKILIVPTQWKISPHPSRPPPPNPRRSEQRDSRPPRSASSWPGNHQIEQDLDKWAWIHGMGLSSLMSRHSI
jgi:hypothetical protein